MACYAKLAEAPNPLTQARHQTLRRCGFGAGTWFPLYPRAPGVPPTSRHHRQHVQESATHSLAVNCSLTPPSNPLTKSRTMLWRGANSALVLALAWLLWDQSTMVGAQTSRHHWQHVEGVSLTIACRLPPANTRNPLPHYKNTSIQHHSQSRTFATGTWFLPYGR